MPRGFALTGQDWEEQRFNFQQRGGTSSTQPRKVTERDANRAVQSGQSVEVQRKEHQRFNQQAVSAGANAKKLDEDHETLKVKRVDPHLRVRIMKERQALNWSQQDLAQRISERVSVVAEYENGKAVQEERVIVKMEKALGVHLRGAKAGEPMGKSRPAPKPQE
ncbi:putative Multiprotein bridging factor 1/Helix-turn-helix [Leishmania utingensis]|uniref:Multiprotein bridging factor 1/Helix-turn-helix n=1 Tax=Leishmania utingensis TaxID=653362 RepID=A0AAW3AN83_9TRYP